MLESEYWAEEQTTHTTGSQWGDEGKGKKIDAGAQHVDIVVKTNGGANAGHTIENKYGKFKSHLVPGGFANPEALNIIGPYVVVDPIQLLTEIKDIEEQVPFKPRILVSENAPVVMPWHKLRDGLREELKGSDSIGTTKQGIGETYADHALREGFLLKDLIDPEFSEVFKKKFDDQQEYIDFLKDKLIQRLESRVHQHSEPIEELLFDINQRYSMDPDAMLEQYREAGDELRSMMGHAEATIRRAYDDGQRILGEAGQASLLSIVSGGYPYVTSSNPGIAGFLLSTGLRADQVGRVVGSTKAYMTRVGNGPMPTELHDEMGEYLREEGREYGATTGRPRRTGWFDALATRYGAESAGITEIGVTKGDVLDKLESIKIAVGYEVNGKEYTHLPAFDNRFLQDAKPIYKTMKGWMKDTTGVRDFADFPPEAQAYYKEIESLVGVPITIFSVGPEREAIVYKAAA